MKTLSNKLSEAIQQGLQDMELCLNDPNYIINFSTWHYPLLVQFNEESKCEVCFAGSVMAKSLDVNKDLNTNPSHFSNDVENMLYALDEVRNGDISQALKFISLDIAKYPRLPSSIDVNQNDYNQFKDDMRTAIDMLKAEGL